MVVVVLLVVLVVVVDVVIFLLLMVLTLVVVLILSFAFKTNQKYEVLETICSLEVLRSSSFHPGPPTSEQPRTLKSTSGPPTRTRGTSQFALPQASASNNLATRNLTVRQGCEADSYLRMTDCITQSLRQPHFWQTKPNCPTAPDCGQLSRIVSLQYTKGNTRVLVNLLLPIRPSLHVCTDRQLYFMCTEA